MFRVGLFLLVANVYVSVNVKVFTVLSHGNSIYLSIYSIWNENRIFMPLMNAKYTIPQTGNHKFKHYRAIVDSIATVL